MCGITGFLNLNGAMAPDPGLLIRANNALEHRGPDDAGVFTNGDVGLAMRRLSIIDVAGGHQPLSNENDRIFIVFNGEIYNHRELRKTLLEHGHRFKTDSDTEAILHAYEQWGMEGCLSRLRGMFAFAIWDSTEHALFLCRDRMGIKPLYYAQYGGRIYFSSEIRAILIQSGMPRQIDMAGVDAFMTVGFVPNPRTIYKGIQKLPAAHFLTARKGAVTVRKYWELSYREGNAADAQELTEEFHHLLEESIRMHLMSEVPLGALLSGGIDSATIAAFAQKALETPLKTISISFDSSYLNEAHAAMETAGALGTDHVPVAFGKDSMDDYPRALYFLEEPLAEPVFVTEYEMHRVCRQNGLKVVLTGEGSDELLAGYHWHRGEIWSRPIMRLPFALRAVIARGLLLRSRGAGSMAMYRTLRESRKEVGEYYRTWLTIGDPRIKERIFSREVSSALKGNGKPLLDSWSDYLPAVADRPRHDQMLWLQSRTRMVDDINHSLDRMSMAHSVEARVPFLDHKLWEFCAAVPFRLKIDGTYFKLTEKYLLRNAVKNVVPEGVRLRKKKGLAAPYEAWLTRSRLPDWAETVLADAQIKKVGLFSPKEVRRLRQEHQAGLPDRATLLMGVVALQTWSHLFME
ncbi:MAG: asparagine synthase (glutamine-hydrolyzing) [Syntrophorhabdaceae bacterium]|nr:asparagine synthase (glutamine-hydrolyzing) [Syntrophorhabdaceae bacterium]